MCCSCNPQHRPVRDRATLTEHKLAGGRSGTHFHVRACAMLTQRARHAQHTALVSSRPDLPAHRHPCKTPAPSRLARPPARPAAQLRSKHPVADYIVIFGAAVRADGSASGSLRRRCENAVRYGDVEHGNPFFLPSGGIGRHGPAEALVMRDILVELGIEEQRILLECEARDTLESVRLCTRILRRRPDVGRVIVSTSSYHRMRCTCCSGWPASTARPCPRPRTAPTWAGASGCATCSRNCWPRPGTRRCCWRIRSAVRSDCRSAVTPGRVGYEGESA